MKLSIVIGQIKCHLCARFTCARLSFFFFFLVSVKRSSVGVRSEREKNSLDFFYTASAVTTATFTQKNAVERLMRDKHPLTLLAAPRGFATSSSTINIFFPH